MQNFAANVRATAYEKSKVALGQIGPERVVERGTLTKMWLVHLTVMPEGEKH